MGPQPGAGGRGTPGGARGGGIYYSSGGCNVQMARCCDLDLPPGTIPAFILVVAQERRGAEEAQRRPPPNYFLFLEHSEMCLNLSALTLAAAASTCRSAWLTGRARSIPSCSRVAQEHAAPAFRRSH